METKESFLQGVAQDLEKRIEIDYVDLRGHTFEAWDSRVFLVHLVQAGLAEAVYFPSAAPPVPPGEVLHKKAVVLAPGYFEHVDPIHAKIHEQLMSSAIEQLRDELGEAKSAPTGFFCLSVTPFESEQPPGISNLLARVDALRARGGNVLVFREPELYAMTTFVNRYTKEPVRFVVGLSLMIRAFEDRYGKLAGRFLDALSRLFAENVRIYAYPMTSKDLQEAVESLSATGWEWSETNGWVSAEQLRPAPPLGHLYAYILASNFLVPMQVPAALRAS
jgi:hypothetical protein